MVDDKWDMAIYDSGLAAPPPPPQGRVRVAPPLWSCGLAVLWLLRLLRWMSPPPVVWYGGRSLLSHARARTHAHACAHTRTHTHTTQLYGTGRGQPQQPQQPRTAAAAAAARNKDPTLYGGGPSTLNPQSYI